MRLFIAINIPSDIGKTIERFQKEISRNIAGVKWVPPKNLHITLKFLGEVNDERLDIVKSTVGAVASEFKKFRIALAGTGVFPNITKPRVFWIGVGEGKELLAELAEKMEMAMEKLGFIPEEREFKTHLTIGRFKENKHPLDKTIFSNREFGTFDATHISVIQSTLISAGPIYTVLKEIPL